MKPQEFEAIVKAKTPLVESAPEPIVEATPAPVLKSMDITSINQQYHALLGESSLRGFAPGENGGGTEAYTMEDEELDGMALGELQAIAQAAKKIFASVKQGVPLEAWMYKKITNGNEGLTAVAQQINNPAVREQPGVAEGAPIVVMPSHKRLEKKHKPSLSRGMDPAKAQGEQDARDGKPYNNPYPFKKELGAPGNWEHNSYKASVKPGVAEGSIEKTATGLKHHGEFPDYPREKGVEFQKDPNRLNKSMTGRLDKAFDVHWQKVKKVREQGVAEGFPDDILAMAKKVSPNARTRGSRDEEIARRDAMLAQREKDRMHAPEPKGVSANERASLEAELQQLMPKYDRHYQMIDNYTQHMQAKHIADRVHEIQRKLKPGVAEGDNLTEFDPNEYSERYTVYMNREKIESFPDLEQAVEYVSDILEDEPNAYMFVWEIIDIDGKKVWEMDSHDYVKKNKITIGGKDVGGMLGGLLGVAEGWDPEDDEQWSAEDPKDEMYGVGDAYKRGIQDYRKFMQTKAKPSNPYSYTKQARQADNWEKGFEDGRYKQGMSEIKDPNDSRWSQKYNKDLPESTDYASAVNNLLNEFAGGMGVSSVAVGPGAMKNPAKTGSLFGGSYTQKNSPFKKKATKKESVMKR